MQQTDEQLVERVRRGDRELYARIIERYQDKLYRYVAYLVRSGEDAKDIVQEVFIKVYVNLNGFDTKKKFSSWIYRIAHNESMNRLVKRKRETAFPEGDRIAGEGDIEESVSKKEIQEMTQDCLDRMPVKYAEPLALFYLEEKSYEEIGDILHLPMGTVATRISRAKSLMKQICLRKK